MALKAKRPGAGTANSTGGNEVTNQAQAQAQQEQQAPANVPATKPATAPTHPVVTSSQLVDLNAGVLDNIDDINLGGNYVTVDGSEFLYKATEETASAIEAVITYGKRFYQWYDEENDRYHNSDIKLDDRYKLKFEIRWFEEVDGEPQEHIMTLSTASAMNFINYVKGLAKKGLGVGQVVTKMTISRQHNKQLNIRYSRVEFEDIGLAEQ